MRFLEIHIPYTVLLDPQKTGLSLSCGIDKVTSEADSSGNHFQPCFRGYLISYQPVVMVRPRAQQHPASLCKLNLIF